MDKSTLAHLTVIIIGIGATILTILGKMDSDDCQKIYFFIGGYVFKNGYNGVKKVTKNGKL